MECGSERLIRAIDVYKIGLGENAEPLLAPKRNLQFSAPAKTMEGSGSRMAQMAGELRQGGNPSASSGSEGQKKAEAAIPKKLRDESGKKVGRNDPCPCGSGKKYKKCHGS